MAFRRLARWHQPQEVKPYVVFNPHSGPPIEDPNIIRIAIIDPGIVKCALRVACLHRHTLRVTTEVQVLFCFKDDGPETAYYSNAYEYLDQYLPMFLQSSVILIESQLRKNYDMIRWSQHLISYMLIKVKDQGVRPLIVEIEGQTKTKMLGAPPRVNIKQWCREYALNLLLQRGDLTTAEMIQQTPGYDHTDTICYEVVWWKLMGFL